MIKFPKSQRISYIVKKNTDYNISLSEIRQHFPKASFNSARGYDLHIRVTNVSLEDAKKFFKNTSGVLIESIQNTKYSTSYLTHLISFNNIITPIVLSCGEYKVNNKDGLIQKQLTPTKLNIIGEYNDTHTLLQAVKSSLNKLNPQLSSFWSLNDENDYKKGSSAHVCLEMIKSIIDTARVRLKEKTGFKTIYQK